LVTVLNQSMEGLTKGFFICRRNDRHVRRNRRPESGGIFPGDGGIADRNPAEFFRVTVESKLSARADDRLFLRGGIFDAYLRALDISHCKSLSSQKILKGSCQLMAKSNSYEKFLLRNR
jgi:hypothetical protein